MADEGTTSRVRVKKPAAIKVLNMEAAMKDAQAERAEAKPKKEKKPKAAPVAEKDPRDMTVDELAAELKGAYPMVPALDGQGQETGYSSTKFVLDEEELVIERPQFKNAPYTVVIRDQTGSRLVEEKSMDWAMQTAQEAHAATGRRVSILRPGMKAVHISDVETFYALRAAEERNASAAGQARADALRASQPPTVVERPRFQRRDRDEYAA